MLTSDSHMAVPAGTAAGTYNTSGTSASYQGRTLAANSASRPNNDQKPQPQLTCQEEEYIMLFEFIPSAGHISPHAPGVNYHLSKYRGRVFLTNTSRSNLQKQNTGTKALRS